MIKGGWGRDIASPTCVEVWQPDAPISPHITFPQKKIFKNCISKNILLTSLSRRCHSIWALAKAQGSQDSFFCNLIDNLSHKNSSKGLLKKTHNFFPKGSTLRGVFSLTHLLWTLEKFWQNQHNTTISFPSLFVFARKQLLQILFFLYEIKKKNIWTRKTRQPFCQW